MAQLDKAVASVSEVQNQADDRLRALASGEDVDIHGTMIALQEADIALRTMVSVRDKVVEAYQSVMNTDHLISCRGETVGVGL